MTTTEPKKIGRPPLTNRAQLIAAARAYGFRDLSVGAVTRACGVKYSTFYRHFRSYDELVAALVDDVLAEVHWPAAGLPWRQHLTALADALTDVTGRWPGLAAALSAMTDEPLRLADARVLACEVLVRDGHDAIDTWVGVDLVVHAVIGRSRRNAASPIADRVTLALDGLAARSQS